MASALGGQNPNPKLLQRKIWLEYINIQQYCMGRTKIGTTVLYAS
jgi:hypothetical protein